MLYSELKDWFLKNEKDLPETLAGAPWIHYNNVKQTAFLSINLIESRIKEHGFKKAKKLIQVQAAKSSLENLFNHLKEEENWNKPPPDSFWMNLNKQQKSL